MIWDYFQAGKQSIAGFTRGERGSKKFQIVEKINSDDRAPHDKDYGMNKAERRGIEYLMKGKMKLEYP